MKIFKKIALILSILMISAGTVYAAPKTEYGKASHYRKGDRQMTSSGKRLDNSKLTCAHKSHPMGTKLKVTNKKNGKSVIVEVNDRGPFIKGRIVDLSYSAAEKIGMIGAGVADVVVEVVDKNADKQASASISVKKAENNDAEVITPENTDTEATEQINL